VFTRDEALREVETRRFHVTVHVLHVHGDGGETLGESSFTMAPDTTQTALADEIGCALERAAVVHNEPYGFPKPGDEAAPVATVDERVVEKASAVVDEVTEGIRVAVREHKAVELSSSEVFADYVQTRILNSHGLSVVRAQTEVMVEYVLLATDRNGEEHEIWQSPRTRLLSSLDVSGHIRRYVRYTQDGLDAQLPQNGIHDVVFGEEALDTLWDYFVGQASAVAKYEGWSRLRLCEPVIANVRGEKLTLSSDPTVPGGMASQAYDALGSVCRRVTLIQDNIFTAYVANKKFADLTGVPVTGPMGNIVVAPGQTPYASLCSSGRGPVYELLRFSTLTPNTISGALSGEIRTGYLHVGGKRIPIKGGSVSGNVLQGFRDALFSTETTRRQGYWGPAGVRLAGMTVAGT
jgi:PmbA protein